MYRRKKYNILFLNLYFCGEFAKKKKRKEANFLLLKQNLNKN